MPDYEKIAEGVREPVILDEGKVLLPSDYPKEVLSVTDPRYQGLATARGYDQEVARLKRVHYTHDAMIDEILASPNITQNQLAKQFEKSVPWISRIIGSDSFQAALAKRRDEVTDPFLVATIEERMRGLAFQSLDILAEKLATTQNTDLALKSLDITAKSLGFGARGGGGGGQVNQFIVQLPPKAPSAAEWVEGSARRLEGSK